MPVRILKYRDHEQTKDFVVAVHLDESRVKVKRGQERAEHPETEPDPDWVREFRFGATPPRNVTAEQYRADCLAEVERQCAAELAAMTPGSSGVVQEYEGRPLSEAAAAAKEKAKKPR